jgi:DAK2 domain fusion protein YloV
MFSALEGKIIEPQADHSNNATSKFLMKKEVFDGEFGFCTEFIINIPTKNPKNDKKMTLKNLPILKTKVFDKKDFMQSLKKLGASSEVVVRDGEILKVHCHVPNPVKVLSLAQKFGEFYKIKVENMNQQASTNDVNPDSTQNQNEKISNEKIKVAVISCNNGQGIIEDIKGYGAHFIIEGGQTMNPSAGDFAMAINALNSKEIIILPNNSNVILAARQAAKTTKGKKVVVLPTKTQIQGMVAMIQYNHEENLKENLDEMKEAISEVQSIAITKAIRTTKINKVKIKDGDYMGILDGKIILTNKSKIKTAVELIKKKVNDMSEIVTIYVGMDASIGDGKEIATIIEGECDIEVILKNGGQPTYDFLISIE